MNNIINHSTWTSTSAYGAMVNSNIQQKNCYHRIFLASSSEHTSITNIGSDIFRAFDVTTSGVSLQTSIETTQTSINQIKRLTGLTWEQLSKILNVSRRTLHFWASGKRLKNFNVKQLNLLLETVKYIDRGSASLNRNLLLMPVGNTTTTPFDLLITGKYQEVKNILGQGNVLPKPELTPLSKDASDLRKPISPENLVDALQEPIHKEVGRSRTARSLRSRQNNSEQ